MKKTLLLIGCLLPMSIFAANNLQSCTGCHGQNFEKAALGKSKIVKDMSKEDIVTALKGYKDGTYGGPMKAVMQGQVKNNVTDPEKMAEAIKGETTVPDVTKLINAKEDIMNGLRSCLDKAETMEEINACKK